MLFSSAILLPGMEQCLHRQVNTIQSFHALPPQQQWSATADSCAHIYDSYLICFKWADDLLSINTNISKYPEPDSLGGKPCHAIDYGAV